MEPNNLFKHFSVRIFHYSLSGELVIQQPLSKIPKIGFQDQLLLNAGQKYCRMLQGEHSAILLTFNKLPLVIRIFVLSIFEWPFYTGFTEEIEINIIFLSFRKSYIYCHYKGINKNSSEKKKIVSILSFKILFIYCINFSVETENESYLELFQLLDIPVYLRQT